MNQTLSIHRVAGALGAELSGVDLSQPQSDDTIAEIRQALVEHQVIFFRDQTLTPAQQVGFGARFGPLNIHPYVTGMESQPEVMEIIKEPSDRINFGGGWHSDMSFLETPAIGSILYALELPDYGGDTLFASQAAAYDALSDGLKRTLEGLNAVHSASREYAPGGPSAQKRGAMQVAEADGLVGEYVHPMVLTHPETGRKALYASRGHTTHFKGMTEEESRPLLDYLVMHQVRPEFTCRVRWAPGTLTVWDNRCTQHNAINDYHGQRRHMRRIAVGAQTPQ